jgi:hypothetical protein
MKLIYAQGFSKNEKLEWKPVVFNNVVQSMRLIFDVMSDQGFEFENKDNEVRANHPGCRTRRSTWLPVDIPHSCLSSPNALSHTINPGADQSLPNRKTKCSF